jgi:DNA repair protein RecN (Recombination protein N)
MLTALRIKNLALVADLTIELRPGYNVVTGETGAGKSIIMGALNLVLGERADRNTIRSGADACTVEAVFDVSGVDGITTQLELIGAEPCEEGQLLLKRTFTAAGANRQFINGTPATLNALRSVGDLLVDMHGPHDHQSLLQPSNQLEILDAFGGLSETRESFGAVLDRRSALEAEKAALIVDEATYARQIDLLRFQAAEIEGAKLQPGEEVGIEEEFHRANNASKLLQLVQTATALLAEDESALLTIGAALGKTLQDLRKVDPGADSLAALHEQAMELWHELQLALDSYLEKINVDPEQLVQIEERLNLFHSLKRKYGSTALEIIEFGIQSRAKLTQLESRDQEIERINQSIAEVDKQLWTIGESLSSARRKIIPKLSKAVTRELNDLGFKQSFFAIKLETISPKSQEISFQRSGLDRAEFQFGPNPGEPPRPLRAIASSGEMARVMLAIKTVLASEDKVPVLIFDEVDANVGGETAHVVGQKMAQIGKKRQVLCITHLAPVAAAASAHFVVSKEVKDGRTLSEVSELSAPARVSELARMLGGQGSAVRKHAESLLIEVKT